MTGDPTGGEEHWQRIWTGKDAQEVSWFEEEPSASLELIDLAGLPQGSRIVDVGGGASRLVDRLLARGSSRVTVADLSAAALGLACERLGPLAAQVSWLVADARGLELPEPVDLWHDRAAFHFLTAPVDQAAYLASLCKALRVGGHVVIATFGPDGPPTCSGLPVQRYDAPRLAQRFGPRFVLMRTLARTHRTPWGALQAFTYALFHRTG